MDFKEIISKIENFGQPHLSYWGCALAGEVGELCNLIKKFERDGQKMEIHQVGDELADIFIYLQLTAEVLQIDLQEAILRKIEIVKKRRE